jgi:predicted esterase
MKHIRPIQPEVDPALRGPRDPIRVEGLPPLRAFVSTGADPKTGEVWDVPMLGVLAGVMGEMAPADLVRLRRGTTPATDPSAWAAAERRAVIHLVRGRSIASLELLSGPDDRSAIRTTDAGVWELAPGVAALIDVDWWRGTWTPEASPPGSRLKPKGVPSPLELDAQAVLRVFRSNYPALTRRVDAETWHVRLPRNHLRDRPAGVLAWISPTPDGRLPPAFEPVLDELGFIAVSADSAGNDRPLTDRLQLVLDGIETVRRSWLIDPVRTYVSGFSDGGRCAAILQLALPDVFCGAVPVGGVDSHHNAPTGRGDSFWPARLGKPLANDMRSLRDRRIGVIVGELDVNRAEAAVRVDLMKADGIPARLDVMPGLGHALPPAPGFAESLRWVDEPPREARKAAVDEASKRLGRVEPDPDERAALIGVVRTAPWSDPAWTAAERLGYSRERFLNGHP